MALVADNESAERHKKDWRQVEKDNSQALEVRTEQHSSADWSEDWEQGRRAGIDIRSFQARKAAEVQALAESCWRMDIRLCEPGAALALEDDSRRW